MNSLTTYQEEALNFKHHIALTANAGSGKTFVLSKRYIEIALQSNVKLSSIIAITFTEKAASELYKRISDDIDSRLKNESDDLLRKKLITVRRRLVSAKISTIHSFCAELLKEYSPEAGIDANFRTIDEIESGEMISESISNFVGKVVEGNEYTEDFKYLVRIFGSISSLSSQLHHMFSGRKIVDTLKEKLYSGTIDDILTYYSEEFEKLYGQVIISRLSRFKECIDRINREVLNDNAKSEYALNISEELNNLELEPEIESCIEHINEIKKNILTGSNEIRIRGYLKKDYRELYSEEINYLNDFFENHDLFYYGQNADQLHKNLAAFGKTLIEVFDNVLSIYEDNKRVKGLLDFEDLQLYVLKILENPGVRKSLTQQYKYIMIDEYQDTNEVQYNIFLPILNQLRSGNLFIVGDEKQSIYMFRGAEPEIFEITRQQIQNSESSGKILDLPHSFRLSPEIALFTNVLFGRLFQNPDNLFQHVSYSELISVRDEKEGGKIEFILKDSDEEGDSEADLVAKRILNLVYKAGKESLSFNDIAVLTRKRNSFVSLEKAFNKFNIPFSLIGGKGFFQKQAIHDVYNYLSFLMNNLNDLSLIGILRSPFFSLPDNEIYSISLYEGDSLFQKLTNAAAEVPGYKKIMGVLSAHTRLSQTVALSTLLRKILTDSGYWAVVASKNNAEQEIANIEKLIGLANNFVEKGFKTMYDFVSLLEDSIRHMEDEGQANVFSEGNSVKIMTIHKAKGLEFPAVFLYACNDYGQLDSVKSRNLAIDKQFGLLTKLPLEDNYFKDFVDAPINCAYNYKSRQKAEGELKRLLYVAVTRARDYLFISATHKAGKSGSRTFLKLLEDGLRFNLEDKSIAVSGEQEFMAATEEGYSRNRKKLEFKIDIVRDIEELKPDRVSETADESREKIFYYDQVNSSIKNEIVSATKIALFSQCPMKYHLTYNLGFTPLLNKSKPEKNLINFNHNEDEEIISHSDVRGLIVHKLIEMNIDQGKAELWIKNNLSHFTSTKYDAIVLEKLVSSAAGLYKNYCTSDVKKEIDKYSNVKSEFELYMKENDYYLYGIMDKIIISDDKIIIIDFKTDHSVKQNSDEKIRQYKNQIFFYGYLAGRYFGNSPAIELRIVFLENTDKQIIYEFSREDSLEVGTRIKSVIDKIRKFEFSKNLKHCSSCHFEFNKTCVSSI